MKMKKILFIPVAYLLLTSSCNHAELNKSNQSNDSLISVVTARDSSLSRFMDSFNQIEANLDSVAARQQIISVSTNMFQGELKGSKRARINEEITAINYLMTKNRKVIEDLKKKWKGSKNQNAILEKTLSTMNSQLAQKDCELCDMNLKLGGLNLKVIKLLTNIDSLEEQNYLKSIVIDFQTSDLHTAYYIIGESKELKDEKIIDRKGGLLGIGRTSKLKENFDTRRFTKINNTQVTTIPVDGDDVKIITDHPTDSYTLEKDGSKKSRTKNLLITNPDKFWSESKYLVIVKK